MDSEIKVSICMLAYNHGKYIRKAIESVVNQKTNFAFELLIHDDASTDNTADIIREYEKKYPDIIKPIYQTENQHNKQIKISLTYNFPRAKGKYIAMLEGDDYYTDNHKLQLQYDILERNPSCSICVHKVAIKNEDLSTNIGYYPSIHFEDGIHKKEEIFDIYLSRVIYLFHTSSYFIRADVVLSACRNLPEFIKYAPVGDLPWMLYCALSGDVYYIDRIMSVYRKGSIGSWTDRQKADNNKLRHFNGLKNMVDVFDEYTDNLYIDFSVPFKKYCGFRIALIKNDYKSLKKEYSELFNKLSFKRRILIFCLWLFPFAEKLYLKIRKR